FGGLIAFANYLIDELRVPDDLVISGVFALLGGMSFTMLLRERRKLWRILTTLAWAGAIIGFGVYLNDYMNVPDSLMMAAILPSIGLLIYSMFRFYPERPSQPTLPQTQFRQLGSADERIDPLQNPAARDVPIEQRGR